MAFCSGFSGSFDLYRIQMQKKKLLLTGISNNLTTETDFADFLVFTCGGCNFFHCFQSSIIFCFPIETSVPIFHKYGSFYTRNHLF